MGINYGNIAMGLLQGGATNMDQTHSGNGSKRRTLRRMEICYKDIDIQFSVNPSDYTQKEPNRVNITQTKGGAWIDAWGPGIVEISIKGITGVSGEKATFSGGTVMGSKTLDKWINTLYDAAMIFSGDSGVDVGYQRWRELRDMMREVYQDILDGQEVTNLVKLYNWTDNEYWYCYPTANGLELYRSKSKPHVYQYTINLWGIRRIGEPEYTMGVIGNPYSLAAEPTTNAQNGTQPDDETTTTQDDGTNETNEGNPAPANGDEENPGVEAEGEEANENIPETSINGTSMGGARIESDVPLGVATTDGIKSEPLIPSTTTVTPTTTTLPSGGKVITKEDGGVILEGANSNEDETAAAIAAAVAAARKNGGKVVLPGSTQTGQQGGGKVTSAPTAYSTFAAALDTQADVKISGTTTRTKRIDILRQQCEQFANMMAPIVGGYNGYLIPTTAYFTIKDLSIMSDGQVLYVDAFDQYNFLKNPELQEDVEDLEDNRLLEEMRFAPLVSVESFNMKNLILYYPVLVLTPDFAPITGSKPIDRIRQTLETSNYFGSTIYGYIDQYKRKRYLTNTDIKYLKIILIDAMTFYIWLYLIGQGSGKVSIPLTLTNINVLIRNIQSMVLYLEFNATDSTIFYIQNVMWELRRLEGILHQVKTEIIEYL